MLIFHGYKDVNGIAVQRMNGELRRIVLYGGSKTVKECWDLSKLSNDNGKSFDRLGQKEMVSLILSVNKILIQVQDPRKRSQKPMDARGNF